MKWLNSAERYGVSSMALHGLILLLFIAVYAGI
jgi:superoxide oxidase